MPPAAACFIAGALVAVGLAVMRVRYVGWPFHPLGYALPSWTTMVFCFDADHLDPQDHIVHYGG
jgi:hypothetical protein